MVLGLTPHSPLTTVFVLRIPCFVRQIYVQSVEIVDVRSQTRHICIIQVMDYGEETQLHVAEKKVKNLGAKG